MATVARKIKTGKNARKTHIPGGPSIDSFPDSSVNILSNRELKTDKDLVFRVLWRTNW